jgi:hypothetical protein
LCPGRKYYRQKNYLNKKKGAGNFLDHKLCKMLQS